MSVTADFIQVKVPFTQNESEYFDIVCHADDDGYWERIMAI